MRWLLFLVVLVPLVINAPVLGMLVSPWAPWWFSGQTGPIAAGPPQEAAPVDQPGDPGSMPVPHGGVTDAFRYQLARAAGFSPAEAIIATAISIAEDGSGDPNAVSPENWNHTRDAGLWQLNSSHWAEFGGLEAVLVPTNNAHAAHVIYARAGWCSWSTYLTSCGAGYTGAFAAFLSRAQAAAQVQPLPGEA